jgi:hypothetical protein
MSGLREAFDEIVADVPVYGDLDRAIEQAAREQRRRLGAIAGLAAAAAVLVVIAGLLAVSGDTDSAPPVSPTPTPSPTSGPTPSPTRGTSQSPQTWADTEVAATRYHKGWLVPDPFDEVREGWFPVVSEHLDPGGDLEALDDYPYSWSVQFRWPARGTDYQATTAAASGYDTSGTLWLQVEPRQPSLLDDGCAYERAQHPGYSDEEVTCRTERLAGPGGERAEVTRWGRTCTSWEGGGPAPTTCGDYEVAVAVERRDGLVGYVVVSGRGTPDFSPVTPDAMAAAAADPRLTIPQRAYAVPSDEVVMSAVEDHVPGFRNDPHPGGPAVAGAPGYGDAWGHVGRRTLVVSVLPAGRAPQCGSAYLLSCTERRVYGDDDATTVFVGAWDEEDWASCCPKNSRADSRELVYVGPRHTVWVQELLIVKEDEGPISADLDKSLIDLVLDPRLQ